MSCDAAITLPAGADRDWVSTYGLIAVLQGFDVRLKALESKFEGRRYEVRSMRERDQGELARLEWELRAGLAEITTDIEDNDADCGCTVTRWRE